MAYSQAISFYDSSKALHKMFSIILLQFSAFRYSESRSVRNDKKYLLSYIA